MRQPGKRIGGSVYLHRSALRGSEQAEAVAKASELLPPSFAWDVAKVNERNGAITFVAVPDFDTADEPSVGDAIRVTAAGELAEQPAAADPWIYHHKWQMVREDYAGFSVARSRARSAAWESLEGVDRSRIGKRSWWKQNITARLEAKGGMMPVTVKPEDEKWRVVDVESGELETNAAGTPIDGGGHDTEAEAKAQARAINARKDVRGEFIESLRLGLPGFLTSSTPDEVAGLGVIIRTAEPVGPFAGITSVPVSILEMLPTSELKRLEDQRHLFWVPFGVETSEEVREEVAPLTADERKDLMLLSGSNTAKARDTPSAPMRFYGEAGLLVGDVLDFGAGKDPHNHARYDPAHHPDPAPLQRKWDTVTCNYVLNVLPLEGLRTNVMLSLRALVREGGQALVSVWRRSPEAETFKTSRGYQCGWSREEWSKFLGRFWAAEELKAPGDVWAWRLTHRDRP